MNLNKSKVVLLPLVLGLCAMLLSSCAMCGKKGGQAKAGQVEHVVLVWLKEPGNAAQRAKVVAAAKTFKDIPGVLSVSTGEVLASDRPIVDDSFDVGTIIRFKDKAAGDAYGPHPIHQKAVTETLKPLSAKILIYDYTVK